MEGKLDIINYHYFLQEYAEVDAMDLYNLKLITL